MHKDTYVIIPVYNEGPVIASVIRDVFKKFSNVICVNDGSSDNSLSEIRRAGAIAVNHPINLGQGASIQTGIEYSLQDPGARHFITFDADGQHRTQDAEAMLKHLKKQSLDIVLGSRFLGSAQNIPQLKKILLKAAIRFSNLSTGVHLTDAHNGLRAFNRHVAENLNITMPDMAHSSEIIHRIAECNFMYEEIPVTTLYTEYSKAKGQPLLNSVNIMFDELLQKVSKK